MVAPQGFFDTENKYDIAIIYNGTPICTQPKFGIHTSISRALRRISWYHFGHS